MNSLVLCEMGDMRHGPLVWITIKLYSRRRLHLSVVS